ncbi:hypothetical protein BY996DRAFT_6709021 [Phakopsora pachyrhizi]|nr:hypothetical protein BY996DRAFT_6709021 [Phakopsora pachyrhizi]
MLHFLTRLSVTSAIIKVSVVLLLDLNSTLFHLDILFPNSVIFNFKHYLILLFFAFVFCLGFISFIFKTSSFLFMLSLFLYLENNDIHES